MVVVAVGWYCSDDYDFCDDNPNGRAKYFPFVLRWRTHLLLWHSLTGTHPLGDGANRIFFFFFRGTASGIGRSSGLRLSNSRLSNQSSNDRSIIIINHHVDQNKRKLGSLTRGRSCCFPPKKYLARRHSRTACRRRI